MENGSISVIIADDQAVIRDGLRMILERDGFEVIGVASSGRQAMEMTLSLNPDVLVLNIRMPDMDGLQALAAIKSAPSPCGVVMHTAFSKPDYVVQAISLGAAGFLSKDRDPENIPPAIRAVAEGEAIVDRKLLQSVMADFGGSAKPSHFERPPGSPELTPQEERVLTLMASGLDNAAIAKVLDVSTNTVKSHAHHLFDKLGVRDRTQAVIWAISNRLIY